MALICLKLETFIVIQRLIKMIQRSQSTSNRIKNINKKINVVQIMQGNLAGVAKFLQQTDINSLKLTCQAFYYYFITAELWIGIKLNIAEQKLEYFDDFEFTQDKETVQITKKDKNIRIHSLKKQNQDVMKKRPKRQSSNIKQKAKTINENNQLLFRNTEIGFKRLLKTNSKLKSIVFDIQGKDSTDLPRISNINDYIIKINDPWSLNMSKVQNLIILFKKLNQFHHKYLCQLKQQVKQISQIIQKMKKSKQKFSSYENQMQIDPFSSVVSSVQGCKQNFLIDEQLNKICRLFYNNHANIIKQSKQIPFIVQVLQKFRNKFKLCQENKLIQVQSINFIENLSELDEAIDAITKCLQQNKQMGAIIASNIIVICYARLEDLQTSNILFEDTDQRMILGKISWRQMVRKSYFCQTMFQIIISIVAKMLRLAQLCSEDITIPSTVKKIKNWKVVCQSLLNISKYFGKLRRQVEQKQKNSKDKTPDSIKNFLAYYETKQKSQILFLIKNVSELERIMADFKQKVSLLKNKMQTS